MRKNRHFLTCILLLVTMGLHAQTTTITGKVVDATGSPIPSATIRLKNSKAGTSADTQGEFTIKAPMNSTLLISGIGYELKEVKVTGTTLTVSLNADSKSLSEVVVTGVGVATSKKKLGISVESVTAAQLPAAPSASVDQALIGKIPGAQISSVSGNPGDPVNILLRGINSIQGGTQPLIMLDGIQVRTTDLNSLDLSTIDRVEVVQGAASAALYGAQGANGVIQLFSKKGKKGSPAINFSSGYASNSYINVGKVNKSKFHPYRTDASNNIVDGSGNAESINYAGIYPYVAYTYGGPNRSGIYNPNNINDKPYNANFKWYDHFAEVFQKGSSLNNSINISGAGEKIDYAIGVSNNHTVSPVMKNGYVDRTNVTANIGAELFKGFRLRSITQLVYTRNTMVPGLGGAGGTGYGYGNIGGNVGNIFSWLNTPAFYDLKGKLSDGTYPAKQETGGYLGANAFNPFFVQEYSSGIDNRVDILQDFAADYTVNKFVSLDAKFGINYRTESNSVTYLNQSTNINVDYYSPTDTIHSLYAGAYAPDDRGEIDKYHYENTFKEFLGDIYIKTDWQNDFHSKLPITTSTQGGVDYRKTKYTEYDFFGASLPIAPPINELATGSQGIIWDYVEPFVTYGFLVNQKIDYGEYFGVAGGFRSDFSSAFGKGSKAFTFPHADAHINLSSLKFWEDGVGNVLSFFKIRGAYGQAGIQPGAFQRYPVINQGDIGTHLVYSIPSVSNNPNLGVEVSTEKEVGADLTITTSRSNSWLSEFNLSGTYWHRKSDHVIWTVNTAPSQGITGELTNAITLHSQGIQFSLNMPVYKSKNFGWDFTINYGHEMSVLDNIIGENQILLTSNGGTAQVLQPGTKIGQISGYKALTSLDETNQEGVAYIDKSNYGNYQIINGRVVDTATKYIQFTNETYPIGDGNPKFNASFINGFNYKGIFTLSFQFDWVYGAHRYNQTKEWMYRDGIHNDFDKKVTINGQTAAFTSYWSSAYYNDGSGNGNDAARDFFYESASFLRLRNAAFSFDAARLWRIPGVKKLQVVLTGRNIWTKTKYTGMDPELSSGGTNSAWDRVVDQSTIPNIKSYQVGVNVGF